MMIDKDNVYVGHRYLVKTWPSYRQVDEVIVLEVAKSHIKLRYINPNSNDAINWKDIRDIEFIEDLGPYSSN